MGEKTKKLLAILRDFGRKPYMYGSKREHYTAHLKGGGEPGSYREQISKVSEFAIRAARQYKSSELKKPYRSDDFQAMEHFFSPINFDFWFDWEDFPEPINWWTITIAPTTPPTAPPPPDYCLNVSRECSWSDGEHNNQEGYSVYNLSGGPGGSEALLEIINIDPAHAGQITLITAEQEDGYKKVTVHWTNYLCEVEVPYTLKASWLDGCGVPKECETSGEIPCNLCEPPLYTEMEWGHENNYTPINVSSNGVVSISGGKAPFDWSVAGTGFSFDGASQTEILDTSATSVTVYVSGAGCGTGSLTVEDDCGESITTAINTDSGTWKADATDNWSSPYACKIPGSGTQHTCNDSGAPQFTLIAERYGGSSDGEYRYFRRFGTGWLWHNVWPKAAGECSGCTDVYAQEPAFSHAITNLPSLTLSCVTSGGGLIKGSYCTTPDESHARYGCSKVATGPTLCRYWDCP